MLVKYVRDPDSKLEIDVRLIYIEEAALEDVKHCQEVEFVEGEVFKTSTRSMKKKDYQELREEMSWKKDKKKAKKKDDTPGGKQLEGIPKELDPAYDRNDPKYFQQDISEEVKDLLKDEKKLNQDLS